MGVGSPSQTQDTREGRGRTSQHHFQFENQHCGVDLDLWQKGWGGGTTHWHLHSVLWGESGLEGEGSELSAAEQIVF